MPHRKKATTLMITVLRIDKTGKSTKGNPKFAIIDATGQRFHTKPDAGFAFSLVEGDALAGEDMRLHLNGSGLVTSADWGELLNN